MLRRILIILLSVLFVLIVAFGVVMGGYVLADAMEDAPGARALLWVAKSCLLLLAIDVFLLIGVLGVRALVLEQEGVGEGDS